MSAEVLRYAAFTRDGRGGNPAGVVLDASGLSDDDMLAVAAEVGYSETAFAVPGPVHGELDVRFFSPLAEVAFCGHATIALAVALAERVGPGSLALTTPTGPVAVSTAVEDGTLRATLTSPPSHSRPADAEVVSRALAALAWSVSDLDPALPAHVAFAGNEHLVLAAASAERLADLSYDFDDLQALMAEQGWTTVCLFRIDPVDGTVEVRNPFPPGGVVEDPATGAAAAALGGYLRDLGVARAPAHLTLHQGHHMGRPSRLDVELPEGSRSVLVSGAATEVREDAP